MIEDDYGTEFEADAIYSPGLVEKKDKVGHCDSADGAVLMYNDTTENQAAIPVEVKSSITPELFHRLGYTLCLS